MAYIGKDLNNLGDVQTLDNITFNAGAGPYNLQKDGVQVTDADTDSIMIAIDGVVQGGNYTVNSTAGTITFDFSVSSSSVCNFVKLFGSGVQNVPKDSSVTTTKLAADAVTSSKIADGTIVNADINNSAAIAITKLASSAITINGSAVSLGGSVTVGETKPTISSISPSVIDNTTSTITITGTNYISVPYVDLINASTGAITQASTVSFTNATTLVITTTLSVDGTYYLRIENNDGNAVRSSTALLTVSDAPAWTTSAGSLGSFAGGSSIGTINLTATDSTSMAVQSGSLPGGITLNSSAGTSTLTGTESGASADTTYNFTIRATDAEAQTADRAFSLTFTFGASNAIQFN